MIYIRYDKPINQSQTKYSAFITFAYNATYVEKIKQLMVRFWIPAIKAWEIPTTSIGELKNIDENLIEVNHIEDEIRSIDDLNFKTTCYPHQLEGVKHGIVTNSWLLGDQQGLGKTKQIIDLAVWRKRNENLKHCLIICGVNNLKYNWVEEIIKHSDEDCCIIGKHLLKNKKKEPSLNDKLKDLQNNPEEFFWITNIETLRCKKEGGFWKSAIVDLINKYTLDGNIGLVVVDEIHKAKNPNSAQGRGLLKLKGCAKIGLSGTLLVNNPLDLFVPLSFIGAIQMNYYSFLNVYTIRDSWGHPCGYQNMKQLQKIMDMFMLRRTKDLLDLPPKIHKKEYLEMSTEEDKLYQDVLEATRQEVSQFADKIKNPVSILSKLTRLRQVCCHTALISGTIYKSSKFERLEDILEEAKSNNEKVIVFSMFRELVTMALCEFQDYEPLHIYGGMSQPDLRFNIDTFQNKEGFAVLFGVTQAAGVGITLNSASIVVFLDLPWNRATMEQAEDRAHRIGTKNTITVISLLMKNTYDEYLDKIIYNKKLYGDMLVDGKNIEAFKKFLKVIFREEGENS